MPELSRRQQRFVDEYLVDLNGAAAARRLGYAESSARTTAWRYLRINAVREAVMAALARRRAAARVQLETVMGELARVAFFDPARMIGPDGRLLPLAEMDADTRAGLGVVDIVETDAGEDTPAKRTLRVRGGQKVRALLALARHTAAWQAKQDAEEIRRRELEEMTQRGFTLMRNGRDWEKRMSFGKK